MKLLVIDSTCENLIICACDEQNMYNMQSQDGSKKHNSLIISYIDETLSKLNLKVEDLDAIGCVVGAGSFTGIRIGIATAKALSSALSIPTIAITSFDTIAYNINEEKFAITINANHNNYYIAFYEKNWQNCIKMGCVTLEELEKLEIFTCEKTAASDPKVLLDIAKQKFLNKQFEILEPLYLKKSQAERERDGE